LCDGAEQVLGARHPEHLVQGALAHGVHAVRGGQQLAPAGIAIVVDVHPRDVGAQRHDGALGQAQHTADHGCIGRTTKRDDLGLHQECVKDGLMGTRRAGLARHRCPVPLAQPKQRH
jgi:hypothetical protein